MTSNRYLKQLLGEASEPELEQPEAQPSQEQPEASDQEPADTQQAEVTPKVQELVQQWKSGDHMAVAARLMFTEANYADFVDLVFIIGHDQGKELGHLLDELADTENLKPPSTPSQYKDVLSRVADAENEEDII